MPVQIEGAVSGVGADVLTSTRALLATLRAHDVGSLGAYSMGFPSGIMAAALASNSPIFSFRYTGANIALLRRLRLTMGVLGTGFTAGQITFNLFAARSWSAADSGGNAATVSGDNGKLRKSHASPSSFDIRYASTAALTPGTRTKDTTALRSLTFPIGTGTSQLLINPATLIFGDGPEEWPAVLANNEGVVLEATVPATGTWCFSIGAQFEEVSSY